MKAWINALRLRTLPLAIASILTGAALTLAQGVFNSTVALLCLLTTVLLQILSNLANDYGDFVKGTDNKQRLGPQRALQSGAITPKAMRAALVLFSTLSLLSGIALLWASDLSMRAFLLFLCLGLMAIWAAITYTVGKRPYGYRALGDVFVFLFFGPVAVLGSAYLIGNEYSPTFLLPASAIGLLAASVLHLNNMRDHQNDAEQNKRTLAVLLGFERSKSWFAFSTILAWCLWIGYGYLQGMDNRQYIWLLPLPVFIFHIKKVLNITNPKALDPFLKRTVLALFATALLFTLANMW